jgi:molybdopterin-synthase adenylyltransferase
VLDTVVHADAVLGCTDQQHSRLALSDLARRYLVPALDCGVALEGRNGVVSGQVIQCVRFLPRDPCPFCRDMILPERVAQELMSEVERAQRRAAADTARKRGEDARGYWRDQPQLNTVGYLTTAAGALAAGYIGWLTGRFDPPFTRLQMNLVAPYLDVTDADSAPKLDCTCRRALGWADQGAADALITAPSHWPAVRRL